MSLRPGLHAGDRGRSAGGHQPRWRHRDQHHRAFRRPRGRGRRRQHAPDHRRRHGPARPDRRRRRYRQRHVDLGDPAFGRDRYPPSARSRSLVDRLAVLDRVRRRRTARRARRSARRRGHRCVREPHRRVGLRPVTRTRPLRHPLPSHYVGVPTLYLIGVGAALLTSVFAGLYPSVKAARLEPLETLRLG